MLHHRKAEMFKMINLIHNKQEEKVIEIGKKEITVSLIKVEMIAYFSAQNSTGEHL